MDLWTFVLMQTFKEFYDKVIDEIHHFGPNEIQPPVDFNVTKVPQGETLLYSKYFFIVVIYGISPDIFMFYFLS